MAWAGTAVIALITPVETPLPKTYITFSTAANPSEINTL